MLFAISGTGERLRILRHTHGFNMNKQMIKEALFILFCMFYFYALCWLCDDGYYPPNFVQETAWTQEEIDQYWQP